MATTLSSPVAGLFLILIAAAWLVAAGLRAAPSAAWALVLGAAVTGLILAVAFPEGGTEPFAASSFWPALAATGLGLWVTADGPRSGTTITKATKTATSREPKGREEFATEYTGHTEYVSRGSVAVRVLRVIRGLVVSAPC